ncbi:hypothetical protein M758_4G016100 [Ceratodon purpureus]|nr:hypothetical protein M758_4G016100 [Ceratodon purpureus]
MEKETELLPSRKSGEKKPLQPLPQLGKTGLFKLPQPETTDDEDDDGNDCISLKEWQPTETKPPTLDMDGTSYSAWQPVKEKDSSSNGAQVKGSVRSRPVGYTPLVESNGEVCLPPSIHAHALPKLPSRPSHQPEDDDEDEDLQEDDQDNGMYEDGLEDDLEDDVEAESANHITEPENTDHRPKVSHHMHNISLSNGIAPQPNHPTGGIAFDISLDDQDDSRPRRSTGSSRGSSLRVSFINEVVLDSPSPPRHSNKSPFRSRSNHSKSPAKSKPGWDSSAKIGKPAPPMPKKFVRPTLHGIKVKKGQGGVAKTAMRASTSVLDTENGFTAREGRPREAVARSWDPQQYVGGGEYDSVSQLISRSLVTPAEDNKKSDVSSNGVSSKPARPFLPRSNGAGKNGEHVTQNGDEGFKSKDNGNGNESNKLTGDFTKLFSKALRRASAPLSKPPSKSQHAPTPKPTPAPLISKISRANSTPVENPKPNKKNLAPLHSLDSSGANQKYAIGSYASLKLLQECAQTEKAAPTPAFSAHKPRKIRDHEPHRHYYKTISKTLDSKLKS